MSKGKLPLIVTGLLLLGVLCVQGLSQEAAGQAGQGGRRGQGRQRGGDPAQMRQAMMDRMKEALGASDEEWKVIQPKLEKVMTQSRETRGGMGMRGRGGRNNASQPAPEPQTEVGKADQALTKVLENKDAKPDEIKAAVQSVRDARAKAKAQLDVAQKELREVLSVRQEAVLVSRGILD